MNAQARGNQLFVKAKFHYASWFGDGSKLVRSWFEPASVMEFGFNRLLERLQAGASLI